MSTSTNGVLLWYPWAQGGPMYSDHSKMADNMCSCQCWSVCREKRTWLLHVQSCNYLSGFPSDTLSKLSCLSPGHFRSVLSAWQRCTSQGWVGTIATTNNTSPRICNFSHHGEHSKSDRFWLQSGSGQPIFTWGSWTNVSLFDRIPNSVQFWSYQRINHYNSFSLLQEVFFHCSRSLLLVHPYLLQTRNSNNLTDCCL